ncbi:MAG TPA: putative porin [Salinimicrobium sp.]|nr:putative porin [Salinimicrobium sp.]
MHRVLFFLLLLTLPIFVCAQTVRPTRSIGVDGNIMDEGPSKPGVISKKDKPSITAYKIITVNKDTTFVDTTLHIYKDYKFNYLRKDNFELLPFSNVGPKYNQLSYSFDDKFSPIGGFGAESKHTNFYEADDIFYYHVPTPLTELYFKTAVEQGQQLDAFFTTNVKRNFNFSIAYKGVRSLGNYKRSLTSSGNFRSTVNYHTLNKRYQLKMHFVSQDILTQESGGLTAGAIQQYLEDSEEVGDRSLLEVNLTGAENVLKGKRFYLNQVYQISKSDSLSRNSLTVGHILNFSDKKYLFQQTTPSPLLGPSFQENNLRDEVKREDVYNEVFVGLKNKSLGELRLDAGLTNYNYGYNSIIHFETETIPNRLIGETVSVGAQYTNNFAGFDIELSSKANILGDVQGNFLGGQVSYTLNENNAVAVKLQTKSEQPNFNFLLYQSDYINYNWNTHFKNEKTNLLSAQLESKNIANLELSFGQINDYAYFALNQDSLVNPYQSGEQVEFVKMKASRQFEFGKFALDNTLLYQKVLKADDVLNMPQFVTRNTFYYQDHWFKKALFLQTGFTFKYFSNYRMNGYDPVLSEFYVQNHTEFEGFPMLDFFFNAKIKQTRIFFKLENLDDALLGNDNFSAPSYPHRDFTIRFGLVWNFFL